MSSSSSMTLKDSYIVTPKEPTWCGCLPLSEWSQVGMITHVPLIYFYRPPPNWLIPPTKIATTLRHSLSKILVQFYPLAGRLQRKSNGRFDLECNAMGVQFMEAETSLALTDLGDFSPSSNDYCHYLFPRVDYTLPVQELPLLIVQLTKFKCGGISISFLISHIVSDGQSVMHFIFEWAQLARGESLKRAPFLDRNVLHGGEPCNNASGWEYNQLPLLLENLDSNVDERKEKTKNAILKVSEKQVEKLRKIANESWNKSSNDRDYSRYETITAHIWRSACKARGHKNDQPTAIGVCVDWRSRVKPNLPKEYFGNAILDVLATSMAGDLMSKPLGYASSRIREAIEQVNDEYVRLGVEYFKKQHDLTKFQDIHDIGSGEEVSFYRNPNLGVVSWLELPIYGMDFGWGKEIYMGPGFHEELEGDSLILPSPHDDGSLLIYICLQEDHMDKFKRHFYQGVEFEFLQGRL
ncbi:spermidine hydroxycinnamoyl transferase-like [Vicia villosa]|uniref:spermidine hydroxycinnamoyl transferase-like n=1 Tax=Vicia villosa TaxID=3911 RepID=UPI00273BBD8C|nr:spermidine hydroxycinnamoyl transferase-like [Vicia villosa]